MKKFLLSLAAMACLVPAFSKTDLSKYVIVYPAAAEAEEGAEIAAAVAAEVALQTGVQIPVVTDETPAVKKEILIGRTNRPESAAFYAGKPDTFDWFLGVKGGKVVVAGGGCWALMRAVERLGAGVPKKPEQGNIYGECIFKREEGTNLRILDDNIWDYGKDVNTPEWEALGADCSDNVRARGLLEIVWAFMPDIVTLQEYGPHMDPYFRPEMEARGYKMAYIPGEVWNHTPIFYNPAAVTLKETKYHKYEPADWSNKGSKSYGIVRMHSDYDTFIETNFYRYTYVVNAAWGTYESSGDGYFIPNSWVIDWVNLAIKNEWAWNVASPSLDSGWTYCAETSSDKSRYGTSVIRKSDESGKLVDTNNSTNDFLPRQKPSLAQ